MAGEVPWAVLSAGVNHATFLGQVEIAMRNGASGVIAGRSLWKDCISLDRDIQRERLKTIAVSRLREIQAVIGNYRQQSRLVHRYQVRPPAMAFLASDDPRTKYGGSGFRSKLSIGQTSTTHLSPISNWSGSKDVGTEHEKSCDKNSMAIGIDIGGTNLRAARISGTGEILERISEKSAPDPELVLSRIAEMVHQLDSPEVAAIGIGVPGRVDARRGAVLVRAAMSTSPRSRWRNGWKAWRASPSSSTMTATWHWSAEMALGAARGHESIVMFTIGTGIGGAVVQAGASYAARRRPGSSAISPST